MDSVQSQCPQFKGRTPYLIVFISSTICIWISAFIFWMQFNSVPTQIMDAIYPQTQIMEEKEEEKARNQWECEICTSKNSAALPYCPICGNTFYIYDAQTAQRPQTEIELYEHQNDENEIAESCDKPEIDQEVVKHSMFDRMKSILLLIVTFYTVTAFIINLYLDVEILFDDNDGIKWICFIAIFSSSPNFKHLICSIILSPTIIIPIRNNEFAINDSGKKIRLLVITMFVFVPGFICYLMPFLYCLICIIILIIVFICSGGASDCLLSACGCIIKTKQRICIFLLLIIGGFVVGVIFMGDLSVCLIHGYNGCTTWRLSWSEYISKLGQDKDRLFRFGTFMADIINL